MSTRSSSSVIRSNFDVSNASDVSSGYGSGQFLQQTGPGFESVTSNSQYGHWAHRTSSMSSSAMATSAATAVRRYHHAAPPTIVFNQSQQKQQQSTDRTDSASTNVNRPLTAAATSSPSDASAIERTLSYDVDSRSYNIQTAPVSAIGSERWRTAIVNGEFSHQQQQAAAKELKPPSPPPPASTTVIQPEVVDSRLNWRQPPLPIVDRSVTTIGGMMTTSRAAKDQPAASPLNHVDLLRDYARYRQLQAGVTAAATVPTSVTIGMPVHHSSNERSSLTTAAGGTSGHGADVLLPTSWRGRRFVNRPGTGAVDVGAVENSLTAIQPSQQRTPIVDNRRQSGDQRETTVTSGQGQGRRLSDNAVQTHSVPGVTSAVAAFGVGSVSDVTVGPVEVTGSRTWTVLKKPLGSLATGQRSAADLGSSSAAAQRLLYRSTTSSYVPLSSPISAADLQSITTSDISGSKEVSFNSREQYNVTSIGNGDAYRLLPTQVELMTSSSPAAATLAAAESDDFDPMSPSSSVFPSLVRAPPDFGALPKRSILKKSRSYSGINSLQNSLNNTSTPSSGSWPIGGTNGSGFNDFTKSPSIPLLYRQRTFAGGGIALSPRQFSVGFDKMTRSANQKRVTFCI